MTEKKSSDIIVTQQGGVVRNILNQLKLIFRLMGDRRVNFFAKLVPVGALIYLVSPIDAVSLPIIGVVDDAALLWLPARCRCRAYEGAGKQHHFQRGAG